MESFKTKKLSNLLSTIHSNQELISRYLSLLGKKEEVVALFEKKM